MSISEFTVKLMVIFLPGIIAFTIIDNLTTHNKTEISHRILYSFILGFICYCPWTISCKLSNLVYKTPIVTSFSANIISGN